MQAKIDSTVKECREWIRMKHTYDNARFPSAGTAAYLISLEWLQKYKEFIFYNQVKMNTVPQPEEGHFEQKHPGTIKNKSLLHQEASYLKGTGTISGFESEVIDTYLHKDVRENQQFVIINEEMWKFLDEKYGSDTPIKRYYVNKGTIYAVSEIESRFPRVPVFIVEAAKLHTGEYTPESFSISYLQMSGKKNFSDLKKRIADMLTAQLQVSQPDAAPVQTKAVRLWLADDKDKLLKSFAEVARSEQKMEVDSAANEDNIEENSGVEFPGNSMEQYVGSALVISDHDFHNEVVVIEVASTKFAFKYEDQGRVQIGTCEFCNTRAVLKVECKCKRVRYCKEHCRKKDEHFHLPTCSAQADDELNQVSVQVMSENGKNGIVGLQNLGNTCYMNSSLQCLSNTYELTKFFLESRFQFITKFEQKNPLGTEGRLVMAYAKLVNEMWNMDQYNVAPQLFKRILGEYAPTFAGFGQHDSHECINTVLDLMGEDLYRKGKKPYVENDEKPNQPEEEAAKEAWNKHLLRNESVMTDLFHGQFKSTVCCSQCDRVSVTFDPWMTLSLPIPRKKEPKDFYFLPYHMNEGYVNKSMKISVGSTDNLRTLRTFMNEAYGINPGSFVVAAVFNNSFKKLHTVSANLLDVANEQGATLLYEIDPQLNPKLPTQATRNDGMYDIDEAWTMMQMNIAVWQKEQYSSRHTKSQILPRLLWIRKEETLKDLHFSVFKHLRFALSKWADSTDPNSANQTGKNRQLIEFPYRLKDDQPMTQAVFDALSDEEAYQLCFKGIIEGDAEVTGQAQGTHTFNIERYPYQVEFQNQSSYEACKLCEKRNCSNCQVAYTGDKRVSDMLQKMFLKTNDSLFSASTMNRNKELSVQVVWHPSILKSLFDFMASATTAERIDGGDGKETPQESREIQLSQCFQDFKQSEILDEDNKWYCNKCKDHVQATKTLEIYRVPRIVIISLKRFKTTRNKYGFGGGQKVDTLVEFPLEGLDLSPFVLSPDQKNCGNLLYDCYGISNHFGSVGFGHYTAYGKNPLDGKWYDFDDSSVTPITKNSRYKDLVSSSAYNIFYRLRSDDTMQGVNLDTIVQRPDTQFLTQLEESKNQ